MRKRGLFRGVLAGISLLALTGCQGGDSPEAEQTNRPETWKAEVSQEGGESGRDASETVQEPGEAEKPKEADDSSQAPEAPTEENTSSDKPEAEEPKESGTEAALSEISMAAPELPETGAELADFVPEGWKILDSAELDFNRDGLTDYVGVLEKSMTDMGDYMAYQEGPRILFAIASQESGPYRLDFQDANLVRTREEGGVFGDPYMPLTAEGTSFTLQAYGGSAWRWSENSVYTYRDGIWYQSLRESSYGYGSYVTSFERDNWETGVGIRRKRSDDFTEMEKHWEEEEAEDGSGDDVYDVEYSLALDEAPTLYQAGMRWWLATERVTDWTVESVELSADVTLSEDRVKHPEEVWLGYYCDEDRVLYEFRDEDSGFHYLAGYDWQDRVLSVLAQEKTEIDYMSVYKEKIYYTAEIVENVTYRITQDGREQLTEEEDTVGIRLNRMNLDGTEKETVFEYRCPDADQEMIKGRLPYLSLMCEISGDEIVIEVYVGNQPHPVYRMNTDGSDLRLIGEIS